MKIDKWFDEISLKNKNLYYVLNIIFGLFFLFPVFGFLYFALKYNILNDEHIPIFFLGFLIFSFTGFFILRKLFDKITDISKRITDIAVTKYSGEQLKNETNELNGIVQSFAAIENQFANTFKQLEKKASEISILKELSELCYVTFDPEEILYVTLERSLILTKSDIGSILILEKPECKSFVVKANIGLDGHVKLGDKIDFETSIAKYAVINKSPIVIEDVEKNSRFGRANRPIYGTKSFVCMPIKTSKEVVGVLTISRKKEDKPYSIEDVEALTPLLSNAAFTYENLRLIKENEQGAEYLKSIDKIFMIINSSFRDSELLHAVLNEIQEVVPFDFAVVMSIDENRPDHITVIDLLGNESTHISRGASYVFKDSIIDRGIKRETSLVVDVPGTCSKKIEKELLVDQGCKTCFLIPLKMGGVVKGMLALGAEKPDIFYDAQNLIEWMANGLSLAISRNNLTAAVVKRNQEMDTLKQIGSALASSTFDIEQVLKYTMDMIRVIMNVEAGSLFFVEGDELAFRVAFNIEVIESLKDLRLKIGQGIAGYAAARGEPIIANDVQSSPHFYSQIDGLTGFKTQSALCVPMISQGKVIGVIEVLNKINGDFGSSDKDLLQSIASSVSIAIDNARLYNETVSMAEHERGIRSMFQKFVPKEILDKIIHGSEAGKEVLEEFKTITLLNIDIRGFSGLTRKIGPQKTVSLLNSFFSIMGGIVFKHHGIVDKYLGDGFLALFGAPVSSTMDADNAVVAALEMKGAIKDVNKLFAKELGASVNIGISIHTGEIVVENFGFDMKMDYTVIGDSVNEVFRMQELAKNIPNGILISENTRRASLSRLEIREMEASNVIDEELMGLKIYELLGHKKD